MNIRSQTFFFYFHHAHFECRLVEIHTMEIMYVFIEFFRKEIMLEMKIYMMM